VALQKVVAIEDSGMEIFKRMGDQLILIDEDDCLHIYVENPKAIRVIEALGTKWEFIRFPTEDEVVALVGDVEEPVNAPGSHDDN
jgi:hypothetical protein